MLRAALNPFRAWGVADDRTLGTRRPAWWRIDNGASHPVQRLHLDCHWDGMRVDLYRDQTRGEVFRIV